MINFYAIWTVARCEARLLWRSWAFRLFSAGALLFLVFFNAVIISPLSDAPHFMRSVSGNLPLFNLKLFNLYQGVCAAFLAAEFIKRDRRQDTIQTIFVRSFTNLDYALGKLLGLLLLFGGLQVLILGGAAAGHKLFASMPFAWEPYLLLPLFISLPTLLVTVGLTWLLLALLRNQPLAFVCALGLFFLSFVLGERFYYCIDLFAFFVPLAYSDFIGLGAIDQVATVRAVHALGGLACIGLTALLIPRLRQSQGALGLALVLTLGSGGGAAWICVEYVEQQRRHGQYRGELRALSGDVRGTPTATITDCQLHVGPPAPELTVNARLTAVNRGTAALDSLLFSLNPGLQIGKVELDGRPVRWQRSQHLLWLAPEQALQPGASCTVELAYSGALDPRYSYLDIDDARYGASYFFFLFRPAKAYAFVDPRFLHLTPESGWYPVAGLSPGAAFPGASGHDYVRYEVAVAVPRGWTAFSQGAAVVDTATSMVSYHFQSDRPLPQVSLTAAPYEVRQIEVDDVAYTLATLPGHDYFEAYFDSLAPVLPETIRSLKNEYEAALGLEYPHARLALVEVPIQFYAYRRLWTKAQETVQPEILFLPEMGTLLEGADFRRMQRRATRSQERANQVESAEQLQAGYLRTLVRLDLLGLEDSGTSEIRQNRSIEARWHLLPQYLAYQTHIASTRWPVLNYAFEAYFEERVVPPANNWNRQWRGLTEIERANIALQEHSLEELLDSSTEVDEAVRQIAIGSKARQLLLLWAATSGLDAFDAALTQLVDTSRHQAVDDATLLALLEELGVAAPARLLDAWYSTSELPGYQVERAESYLVRDGERTRTQVELDLSNPTDLDGLVKLNFRFREDEVSSWWERQRKGWDASRIVSLPARTSRQYGLLLDRAVAELIVDTYAARNIPAQIYFSFGEQTLRREARPFTGFVDRPFEAGEAGVRIVDNEDEGFDLLRAESTSRLRAWLIDLINKEDKQVPYHGLRSWDPPGSWQATTDHRLYGRYVHSSYYKAAGEGRSRVSWQASLAEAGDYDIFFYCGLIDDLERRKDRARGEEVVNFLVYHDDGVDDISLEHAELEQGWVLLGTYSLEAGPARIELTDRSTSRLVVADAVKWVKNEPILD